MVVDQRPLVITPTSSRVALQPGITGWKLLVCAFALIAGLAPIVNNLASTRVFAESYVVGYSASPSAQLIRTIGTAVVIAIGSLIPFLGDKISVPPPVRPLFGSGMLFAISGVASAFLAAKPTMSLQAIVLPVVIAAISSLGPGELRVFLRSCRLVALAYIYGSLASIVFVPGFAVEYGYSGGLLPFRLHGLAAHANHLAPVAVAFLAVDYALRDSHWFWRVTHWLAALAVLVLTQSKTIWLASVLGVLAARYVQLPRIRRYAVLFAVTSGIVLASSWFFVFGPRWDVIVNDPVYANAVTFTGRLQVWEYTVELWRLNPWFGYGHSLWKDGLVFEFLRREGWAPSHAHSQFFQTLGQAGLVGLMGLLVYYFSLITSAIRCANRSRGVAIFLVAVLVFRSVTETAVDSSTFPESFILHWVTFALLVLYSKEGFDALRTSRTNIP